MPRRVTPEIVFPVSARRAWPALAPVWYQMPGAEPELLFEITLLLTVAARYDPDADPAAPLRNRLIGAPPATAVDEKVLSSMRAVRVPAPAWTRSTPTKFVSNAPPVTSRSRVAEPEVIACEPSMRLPSNEVPSIVAVTAAVPDASSRRPWAPVVESVSLSVESMMVTVALPVVTEIRTLSSFEPETVVAVIETTPLGSSRLIPEPGTAPSMPLPLRDRSSRLGLADAMPWTPSPLAPFTATELTAFPLASVMPWPAAFVIVGRDPVPAARSVCAPTTSPAGWPRSRWPDSSTMPPPYEPEPSKTKIVWFGPSTSTPPCRAPKDANGLVERPSPAPPLLSTYQTRSPLSVIVTVAAALWPPSPSSTA